MLKEKTLFQKFDKDKEQLAIDRLQNFEPPDGYDLMFSGGKDSIVIKDIANRANVDYTAYYNLTTVDPPSLVNFIKDSYPDVVINKPETTMWELIRKKGILPSRLIRYCCEHLKERYSSNKTIILGLRWDESASRSNRQMVEKCYKDPTKTYVNPIIDWTDEDVWQYIKKQNLDYCKLYDEGHERLGCIMCPMGGKNNMQFEAEKFPKYYQSYRRAVGGMLETRVDKGLKKKWRTTDQEVFHPVAKEYLIDYVMDWWIEGGFKHEKYEDEDTINMQEFIGG